MSSPPLCAHGTPRFPPLIAVFFLFFASFFCAATRPGLAQGALRGEPAAPAPQATDATAAPDAPIELQRVSTAVPWPRGIVWHDGKLLVLARGRHRSAGGPDPAVEDRGGNLFEVDPAIHEPVVEGQPPGEAVRRNARLFAEATSPPFRIWNCQLPTASDTRTDRPYAGLIRDPRSDNLFVLCFAGIDLLEKPNFRKNATDAVHRYNTRTKRWYPFEWHDPTTVPDEKLAKWLPNEVYPHHDPDQNPPPHGMANGACGGWVVGDYLYVTAKDNSALIQYDLREIRRDPNAGPPPSRFIFRRSGPGDNPFLRTKKHGSMYVEGACAVASDGNYLYVAFRTTSQVVRFPIDERGDVVRPIVADYLAQFDAYDPRTGAYAGPANIFDLRLNSKGECFVSCNSRGSIWKVPTDGGFLDGREGTSEKPFVNLRALTEHKKSTCGNFCFDPDDNLYICTGNKDIEEGKLCGVIYRVPAR